MQGTLRFLRKRGKPLYVRVEDMVELIELYEDLFPESQVETLMNNLKYDLLLAAANAR